MPRVYRPDPTRKRYKKYNIEIIKKAVEEYASSRNVKLEDVAKKYGIHKSVLYRHCTRDMKQHGGQRALSDETESYLIENINKCAEWGYPLDTLDLRYIVKMYLDKIGIIHKRFKDNFPGPDFVQSFLLRHKNEISQRVCENIKRVRAKVSPDTIKEYFIELEKSLNGVLASNILNYDETNLTDDPGRKKILIKRGCKYPERVLNHTKASVSIMMAGTADGKMLPPYVVYKATHLYDSWVQHGPEGTRYNRSTSGWFDGTTFEDWVQNMVIPYFKDFPGRKCLIGDNLSSHLSADLIQTCKAHNIDFVFLPANSTHLTQPLDVAFFRPMKRAWRQLLLKWKKTDGRQLPTIPKGCFPKLLKLLIDELQINASKNIIAGFKKTGISPLNAHEILARLPGGDLGEDHESAVEDSVVTLLKEMRYGSMNIVEPRRKRKLNVLPGKSVASEEIENYAETDVENSMEILKKTKYNTSISGPSGLNNKNKGKAKKNTITNLKLKPIEEKENCPNKIEPYKGKGKGIGKKTKTSYLEAKEIQEKENLENNMENNETKGKEIEDITKKSSLKRIETENKGNNDNNKEWEEEFHNNAEQDRNTRPENYDNVTAYENYDTNMGQQNYNSVTETENYNNNLQELQCKIPNDIDINSLPILFFDSVCEEVTISTGKTADDNTIMENKVKIISNDLVNDGQYNKKYRLPTIKKSKTVAVKDLIKLPKKNHTNNYYNKSDEILKVLVEDDDL
ncbi:uncharacterized protein LOC126912470 [Spodoptera frugiperda]|uniref:Uncharacterized protein LOC126912470 n=1 Tax=Spodoptera frugiperda TaxID=7108 RepID=A0A9R0E941_SPOFR|nr:uncharacterized protein LOC126912470 [Spodoptera frugiperda]